METRTNMKGKGLLQGYLDIEDLIWIDQQKLAGVASSRMGVVHKLINDAKAGVQ